ncbi:BTAD domain-containing putative transcriptional regulator [Kitasatospora sp. NPDC092286]|uniref:AfsR/SARP family transcriptional regulator n=1 Tax=Kitasatospora sp. NPDC092286 TaxID=3364087 RepID=UPI00381C79EA
MRSSKRRRNALELHFTTLGPLKAWRAGRELRINRAQDRAVLAVLLAQAGRPVPVGEIIDGVWGEEGDEAPDRAGALPGNVYRLRSALDAGGPSILRHEAKGYRLDADPAGIDRTAFLTALADAATARRNWQPERARTLLSDALDLWTGRALDDVPGPFAAHERRLLAARRDEARRSRLELDLELRADTWTPAPARTPVRPVLRPFQLPPDLGDFTGRGEELAAVAETLTAPDRTGPPLVTVTGPRGAGKSAFAVHAAHLAGAAYPDGQLYADLHGRDAPTVPAVLAAFVRALGVEERAVPPDPADRRTLYHRLLADRRVLVVLDGAATADRAGPLLPVAPGCAALVTADGPGPLPLGAPGGRVACHAVSLGRMTPGEAQALLGRVLGTDRLAREPTAARTLAAACDHLPGPLRAAADRLVRRPAWPVAALVPRTGGPGGT